ncbi:Fanconi anemia group C protein isoform X1 [Anguilla anguilla]|uniref:Fanconi anemia group C protein isoform X1 n=2 Tax=Anguilla anguilla TaxID=7936 RepID=UPI0015ACD36D|nr:Fanconi anemia group C protein isoform X1 [Anguilla anguilla]
MIECLDQIRTMTQSGPFSERVVEFWVGKAVDWGQSTSSLERADVRAHLPKLRIFLRQLLQELQLTRSTTEAMGRLPFLGQLVGRLCWNPCVSTDGESLDCLLQCLWWLYSSEPQNAVERRANQWIRNLLYHLSVEEGHGSAGSTGSAVRRSERAPHTPTDQRLLFLRNMVALLEREVSGSCCPGVHPAERCPCDDVRGASVTCTALVTCPEAAPLIGALLQHPTSCDRASLSEDFLDALNAALLGKQLVLGEQALMGLWHHSLPSLEGAVLDLVESALSNPSPSPQDLEQRVADSLLPKASAHHHPMFLVVNDVFRILLVETRGSPALRTLIQTFTRCFLLSLCLLDPQERLSLKVFFPHAAQSLLMPLLQLPTDVPEEAWPEHLLLISCSLQKVEEEEEDAARRRCGLFESWFLLVQAGFWVDVAVQLLVMSGPETTPSLLWLLTFYYHPVHLEEHRARTLAMAGEALDLLRALFLSPPPLPPTRIQALERMSSTCPHLLLHLLVNFAVFSHGPFSVISEVVRQVAVQPGRCREAEAMEMMAAAAALLARVERRLSRRPDPDPRVRSRLRAVQDALVLQRTA